MSIRHKTKIKSNMKTTEKKQLLKEVIEKLVLNGYDIIDFIGKPLSYYDFEKVKKLLEEDTFYKKDNGEQIWTISEYSTERTPTETIQK